METAHKFGREGHLAGIVCLPDHIHDSGIAVVIPNAGFIHHVGPWQLHVDLVEQLQAVGVPSIRFDLSGLGDSELPRRRESVAARTAGDVRDAIALLEIESGARRIVMVGLCSGAVDAHLAALAEDRVCGAALLDPPAYPDRLYHVIYWAERLLNPVRIVRVLSRKLDEATGRVEKDSSAAAEEPYRPFPAEEFAAQIEQATRRGVEYLFTYSRDSQYKYRRQLFSILTPATPRARITVYHYPKLEHTPVLVEDRRIISDTLIEWLQDKFL